MKKAVILHATDNSPEMSWYPFVKKELEQRGYEVWVPHLPGADRPNAKSYTDFLLASDWDFTDNLIIGHSSGAVEILAFLQALSKNVRVRAAVLAGAFSKVLADDPDWEQLKGLFDEPFNFELIKTKADKFLFVHGSDDPWCPIDQARELCQQVGGDFEVVEGGQHFSFNLDPAYVKFPKLIEILESKKLL